MELVRFWPVFFTCETEELSVSQKPWSERKLNKDLSEHEEN